MKCPHCSSETVRCETRDSSEVLRAGVKRMHSSNRRITYEYIETVGHGLQKGHKTRKL